MTPLLSFLYFCVRGGADERAAALLHQPRGARSQLCYIGRRRTDTHKEDFHTPQEQNLAFHLTHQPAIGKAEGRSRSTTSY